MRDEIIEHYKILLAIGWLYAEDDGLISVLSAGDLMPATINGKRWILPTREQMKNTNWENRIGFHPVRESYNLGVSDILGALRDQWQARLHASIAHLMRQLLAIANDQKNQKNLTPDQSQVLNALPKVTANTVATFASLLKNTASRGDADQFIKIMIRRGGTVKGKVYGRAGLVKFPIYEALTASKDTPVNGVTMTNKDRTMLISLFEFIFPSLKDDPEAFNVGIDSRSAPFMESLTRCTFKVIKELRKSAEPYLSIMLLPELLEFPANMDFWLEAFDSKDMISLMASTIPNMSEFDNDSPPVEVAVAPVRESRSAPEVKEAARVEPVVVEDSRPRGRLIMGSPAGMQPTFMGKATPGQKDSTPAMGRAVSSGRGVLRADEADREAEKRRREEEDRERRERDRQEEEDRKRDRERRDRERDEDDRRDRERERDRGGRDSRDDRDDRYERDRPRRDSRDSRDERRSTGDVFEDNPALRTQLRDVEDRYDDRGGRGRGRGRDDDRYVDPRDTRGGRSSRSSRDDRDYYDDRDDRSRSRYSRR